MKNVSKFLIVSSLSLLGTILIELPVSAAVNTEQTPLQVILERKIAPVPLPGNPDANNPGSFIDILPINETGSNNKISEGNNGISSVKNVSQDLFSSFPKTGSIENKSLWREIGLLGVAFFIIILFRRLFVH